eukprot:TRINITY_DN54143_c0_g1_i1.p1 TRINITY_DN54143_c0_g1~~TRINITY_DN54143_c0_g1_i1.p1  ORF type:complete len:477 (+),score=122.00 TRINITY_DN54143_c0_g1_i1:104-1534(+)
MEEAKRRSSGGASAAAASEGPASAGVRIINEYGREHFGGCMDCSWTEAKGRILHSTRSYQPGDVVLVESPLHIVQEQEDNAAFKKLRELCKQHPKSFDYEPLWYWCALQSLTAEELKGCIVEGVKGTSAETMRNLLLLHHEEVTQPTAAAKMLVKHICPNANGTTLERLIQIWVLNCFEYSEEPQGFSTYFFSSFMSHSCYPNAVWHYDGADHVLRARRPIAVGDEVCISYLPEDGLLNAAPARRWELHETKRFWCTCERCAEGATDFSRGVRCPSCSVTVFAKTPVSGPAESESLLASEFEGATCQNCGYVVTKAVSEALHKKEEELRKKVEALKKSNSRSLTPKAAQDLEALIESSFPQHVFADHAWEQLADFHCTCRRKADQHRLLALRCEFYRSAYDGLSGAHAWTLEALGDAMSGAGEAAPKSGEGKARQDIDRALELYDEAMVILTKMFGAEHEYVTQVEEKRAALSKGR